MSRTAGEGTGEGTGPDDRDFEPRIIALCCNWCAYAGADLAGVNRIGYPPNVKIIRVMCTGRIEPNHVFHALLKGADGVLVAGCHPGDCHYVSGNVEAEKRVAMVRRLMEQLGIDKERLRLEWIASSEGARFSRVMRDFTEEIRSMGPLNMKHVLEPQPRERITLEDLVDETGAYDCIDCGKCTTLCPIAKVNPDFSPRLIVIKANDSHQSTGEVSDAALRDVWTCLTCAICSDKCPYEVLYSEFIQGLREMARERERAPLCSQAGLLDTISRIHTVPDLEQDRLDWLTDDLEVSGRGEVMLWIGCAPYFDTVFKDRVTGLLEGPRAAVRILNRAGIVPAVSPRERCCGHDQFWAGDVDTFHKLADLNLEIIRETGAKRVIVFCPEGYRTLKTDYPLFVGDLDFEVIHFSEYLAELVEEGSLSIGLEVQESVTYHEGCRLGRHMGIYEEPRQILRALNVEVMEMERNRETCPCCGVNSWLNCSADSKRMQVERLVEAKGTGADRLLVACPKCLIHFRCAGDEEVMVDEDEVGIPVEDIYAFIGRYLE